ncbi:TPA: hypothetical protein HA235_02485 [Candidatus Woesearchaeota archaeon]|nr:hypothetical protein [Candidatus Woesearchaeota archaeon]HIH54290.1 hypothetical protein [Candidatus Woesearchaeota archaeon]HIJ02520.1 hypothetical protein [Candidatus Woesearchaeota archaeon]HIJ13434.1 hypothetical protein [Candidatus Woesearchaeota archaeon]
MLTKNEKNVIKTLLFSFQDEYSINEIARRCNLAPNGAFKILRKLEQEKIIKLKKIANINAYSLDFDNLKTKSICELALIEEPSTKIKNRLEDLKELQKITEAGIIFGSYITKKKNPGDIDLFFVLKEDNFKKYKEETRKIYPAMPLKVQDIIQTKEDLTENILKNDKAVIEILQKGFVLWGQDKLMEIIKNGYSK